MANTAVQYFIRKDLLDPDTKAQITEVNADLPDTLDDVNTTFGYVYLKGNNTLSQGDLTHGDKTITVSLKKTFNGQGHS